MNYFILGCTLAFSMSAFLTAKKEAKSSFCILTAAEGKITARCEVFEYDNNLKILSKHTRIPSVLNLLNRPS
jgi:hypothetical protein